MAAEMRNPFAAARLRGATVDQMGRSTWYFFQFQHELVRSPMRNDDRLAIVLLISAYNQVIDWLKPHQALGVCTARCGLRVFHVAREP